MQSEERSGERYLQLAQRRQRAKLEYCLPFKYTALGLLEPRGTKKSWNIKILQLEEVVNRNTLFAHDNVKKKKKVMIMIVNIVRFIPKLKSSRNLRKVLAVECANK